MDFGQLSPVLQELMKKQGMERITQAFHTGIVWNSPSEKSMILIGVMVFLVTSGGFPKWGYPQFPSIDE